MQINFSTAFESREWILSGSIEDCHWTETRFKNETGGVSLSTHSAVSYVPYAKITSAGLIFLEESPGRSHSSSKYSEVLLGPNPNAVKPTRN